MKLSITRRNRSCFGVERIEGALHVWWGSPTHHRWWAMSVWFHHGFTVSRAVGCAWRARHLYYNGNQVARISLDPTGGSPTRPRLSFAFPVGVFRRTCDQRTFPRLKEVRFTLPYIPWRWCMATKYNPVVTFAYRTSSKFWHSLDGRYQA